MAETPKLTPLFIRNVKTPGYYRDNGDGAATGLYLQVTTGPNGPRRSWIVRYTAPTRLQANGKPKPRWMGLGAVDLVNLAEAREMAREARRLARIEKKDPIDERNAERAARRDAALKEQARTMTFAACVDRYLAAHLPTFRNAKHRAQWESTLKRANEAFGQLPVEEIDSSMIIKFIEPIWLKTPETASRLRSRIEKVLDWARARGFREGENPRSLEGAPGAPSAGPSEA